MRRKWLIAAGMWTQAVAIGLIAAVRGFWPWTAGAPLLGAGTAMVYPTLLATIGDVAHPRWRASSVGVHRLWRDGGFAVGALLAAWSPTCWARAAGPRAVGMRSDHHRLLRSAGFRDITETDVTPRRLRPVPRGLASGGAKVERNPAVRSELRTSVAGDVGVRGRRAEWTTGPTRAHHARGRIEGSLPPRRARLTGTVSRRGRPAGRRVPAPPRP